MEDSLVKPGGTTNPFLPRFSHWRPSRLASWKQMYMQPRNRWSGNVCDNATFHLLFGSPNDEAHRSRPREKRRLRSVQVNFFYGAAFGKDGTPVPVSGLKRITAFTVPCFWASLVQRRVPMSASHAISKQPSEAIRGLASAVHKCTF